MKDHSHRRPMLTTGKGTHYCIHCGFDMKPREDRECPACDGDLCEAKARGPRKKAVGKAHQPTAIFVSADEAKAAVQLKTMLDALRADWKQYFLGMGSVRAVKKLADGSVVRFSIKRPPR